MTIPCTVLDPEGREVETEVEPAPLIGGGGMFAKFCNAMAVALDMQARSYDLRAMASVIDPGHDDLTRAANAAHWRGLAESCRKTAEEYRAMGRRG